VGPLVGVRGGDAWLMLARAPLHTSPAPTRLAITIQNNPTPESEDACIALGGRTLPQVRGCLLHGLADACIPSPTRPGASEDATQGNS